MIEGCKIRTAEPGDLLDIVQLCAAHAQYERAEYSKEGKSDKLHDLLFKQQEIYCQVIELEGSIVGYTTFMKQYSTWDACPYIYLDCIYLQPKARNMGIGEMAMNQVKQFALDNECKVIQWQTPEFNVDAIRFYKRLGGKSYKKERFIWTIAE